jgi:hypothetical protein
VITYGEVEKLCGSRAAGESALSLSVYAPPETAGLREFAARAVGHAPGILVSAQVAPPEVVPLPDGFVERAGLAAGPHVRPSCQTGRDEHPGF